MARSYSNAKTLIQTKLADTAGTNFLSAEVPQLGDIKPAREVGHIGTEKFIWHACIDCGKPRWKRYLSISRGEELRCAKCDYRARRRVKRRYFSGYIQVMLYEESPFYSMADKRHMVFEHRLVVAEKLGRCLTRTEIVHHKNGIKDDNRYENLELISLGNHTLRTKFCQDCIVKKEIRLLQWRIKTLEEQVRGLSIKLMEVN